MRSKLFLGGIAVMAAVIVVGSLVHRVDASTGPIPLNGNRACLENVVDQYLAAVIAHNPKLTPLSADVKYTENDQRVEIGDGLWKTAQARGIVWAHVVFDQGTVNSGVLSTGVPYTFRGFTRPSSILMTEAFLIENGKIRRVEMVGPGAMYQLTSPLGRPQRELTARIFGGQRMSSSVSPI